MLVAGAVAAACSAPSTASVGGPSATVRVRSEPSPERLRLPAQLPHREIEVPILMYHRINVSRPGTPSMERRLTVHPADRSEEHTSELQSQSNLVCRLLLEKKKNNKEK